MVVRSLTLALTFGFVASASWAGTPTPTPTPTPTAPKRDCLAGLCLGATVTGPVPNAIVTVIGHKWERSAEICSGKIVGISIATAWALPGFGWSDVSPEATTRLYAADGFSGAAAMFGLMTTTLYEIKWRETVTLQSKPPEAPYVKRLFESPEVLDGRFLTFGLSPDERGAVIDLSTAHTDVSALCAAKKIEGL